MNPLLLFVFIAETPRESKKRKNRTSPEKDEGTLVALNVRANKYDQYISHNLMSRFFFFFFCNSSYVQRPDDTVIKQPPISTHFQGGGRGENGLLFFRHNGKGEDPGDEAAILF